MRSVLPGAEPGQMLGLSLLEVLARRVELEELLIANRYLDPSQRDDTAEVAHAVERLLEVLIEMHFAELMRDGL